jgi:hypothetical protein
MRTDAWFPSRLRVSIDGKSAGTWEIPRSKTAWMEPRFTVPRTLVTRARTELRFDREQTNEGGDFAPFRFWLYQ